MRTPSFPKELMVWLNSLPQKDRERETQIAIKNIKRITMHLTVHKSM